MSRGPRQNGIAFTRADAIPAAMSGGIEAAGDIATGALLGRAVEPRAGETHDAAAHGVCLNCGTALIGDFCHACGQNGHVHTTLLSIGHDVAHGVFHFEGKIWRTLPMLVLHPGKLTRRYIDGERARFVSPLALFLFTVFLMFAVYSWVGPGDLSDGIAQGWSGAEQSMQSGRQKIAATITTLQNKRVAAAKAGKPVADIDQRIAAEQGDLAALDRLRARGPIKTDDSVDVHSSIGWLNAGLQRAKQNPGLLLYKLQSAAYKYSWALIVLSTPLIALLFLWRRRFTLYDHAIFATYSISFMSLLVVVLALGGAAGLSAAIIVPLILLAPPVHMFAQLRGTYDLRIFSALWRTVMLLFFSTIVLLMFVLGIVAMEVAH